MTLDNQLLFCYLEEDNIQQAYFRVHPLLTTDADIRQEALSLFPAEGCLRIVPDRNEQHSFKSRMRQLGAYCVVDLLNLSPEATKIRTNKNYRPDRGENNQFILYSDTVKQLPEHSFYELIDGNADNYTDLAQKVITPLFYIRQGDVLYGPVRKNTPEEPRKSSELAGMLFTLSCPDNTEHAILCVKDAPAVQTPQPVVRMEPVKPIVCTPDGNVAPATSAESSAPEATAKETVSSDEALPIGESLNILDQSKNFEETLQSLDQPLSDSANLLHNTPENRPPQPTKLDIAPGTLTGTPLVRTPLRTATQPIKNRVQEAVTNQWYIGKYEPPAQNLPTGASMRPIDNPVSTATEAFRNAWRMPEVRDQLLDFVLSLDGLRSKLEPRICRDRNVTALQRVLRDRLQDLEAERLSALCQLDKAHRDLDGFKQQIISGITSRLQQETSQLESSRNAYENDVARLKNELNTLTLQRDALLSQIDALQNDALPATVSRLLSELRVALPVSGLPLRMSPISGAAVSLEDLLNRLTRVFQRCKLTVTRNQGIAFLLLLAGSERIGILSPTPASAATLLKNIANAMGWSQSFAHQLSPEQKPLVAMRPADATPVLLLTSLPNFAPVQHMRKLFLVRNGGTLIHNTAYEADQWPILSFPAFPFIAELPIDENVLPVSQASLDALMEKEAASDEEINTVLNPIAAIVTPLSGAAKCEMYRFIRVAAGMMEGGLPAALDWAILLWLVPAVERSDRRYAELKALLDEYPLSQARL